MGSPREQSGRRRTRHLAFKHHADGGGEGNGGWKVVEVKLIVFSFLCWS
jgi:hypothetical protein